MGLIVYNVIMAVQLVAVLYIQRYSRRPAPIRSTAGFAMAAVGLGAVVGYLLTPPFYTDALFATMHNWAYGLFVYLPVLLLGQAWLLRRRGPIRAGICVVLAIVNVAIAIDAFVLEPHDLQVRTWTIPSPKLDRPYRIAVIADIQTDRPGPYERSVFRRTLDLEPDLILLPGDYVQVDAAEEASAEAAFRQMVKDVGLDAPLGVFAVEGNVDTGRDWTVMFEGTSVRTFTETTSVAAGPLRVTALSFDDSFRTDLQVPTQPGFHIVFGHGPDFALGRVDADLLVAGHTHGGQVRLPGIGPLVTLSKIPSAWADGATKLAGLSSSVPDRTLVVSRGVGMERRYAPRLRFGCRPEIVVIDLKPPP